METYIKKDYTSDASSRLQSKRRLHFMRKENRDRAFQLIKKAGLNAKKSTIKGQQIHPEYIEDYTGEIETGFGNTMYNTFFPILYNLEITDIDRRRKW